MREPWLREITLDVDPAVAAVIFALQQAREDLERFTGPVPDKRVCFHLRHIAGSLDRLSTYLEGRGLNEEQLAALHAEQGRAEARGELLDQVDFAIARATEAMSAVVDLPGTRFVGRERIRVTAIGLIVHMAEHTQRHVGQVISLSRYS